MKNSATASTGGFEGSALGRARLRFQWSAQVPTEIVLRRQVMPGSPMDASDQAQAGQVLELACEVVDVAIPELFGNHFER